VKPLIRAGMRIYLFGHPNSRTKSITKILPLRGVSKVSKSDHHGIEILRGGFSDSGGWGDIGHE